MTYNMFIIKNKYLLPFGSSAEYFKYLNIFFTTFWDKSDQCYVIKWEKWLKFTVQWLRGVKKWFLYQNIIYIIKK